MQKYHNLSFRDTFSEIKIIMKKTIILFLGAILHLQCLFAQDTSFLSVVTTHDELDLSDVDLVAIPTKGPYMLAGNQLSSLTEESDLADLVLPGSISVDDIIWTGGEFIIKSGYEIYSLDNISEPLMDFDTPDYDICPLDEKRIYIVSHQNDTSHLFLANLKIRRAKRLLTIGEQIINVSQLGDATIVATDKNIYMFNGNKCTCYLNLWTPIRSAVMTGKGLVFATNNEICLLTGINQFVLIFEASTKKLLFDEQYLYILLSEGDLLRCDINNIDLS